MADDAEKIRYFAERFRIAGNALVTFQKQGERPVRVRLDELLRILGKKQPGLFEP